MRLLTHNTLRNNSAAAKGKGYPLKITNVTNIRIDDDNKSLEESQQILFVRKLLGTILDWAALVQAANELGITTLPKLLSEDLVNDNEFCKALFHILMNIHLVDGTLICPVTQRQFIVSNEIPNMILDEDECEIVRM